MYLVFQYLKYIVALTLIWIVAYGWSTYGCHKVPTGHMEPVLDKNSYTTYRKSPNDISGIERGDIVLFDRHLRAEGRSITSLTGRVIGRPGDRLRMRNGTLIRNGRERPEPYLQETYPDLSFPLVVVPKNHLYVLADNRTEEELDSRSFGPIPVYTVVGSLQ